MAIVLKIVEDGEMAQVMLERKHVIIGRSKKVDFTVNDSSVSGSHVAIGLIDDGRVLVKDLESTNGTFINGRETQETFLYINDTIKIGKVKISLDESQMTPREKVFYSLEYKRTSVSYVQLNPASGEDDTQTKGKGVKKKARNTLLFRIRKAKEEATKTHSHTKTLPLNNHSTGSSSDILKINQSDIKLDLENGKEDEKKKQEHAHESEETAKEKNSEKRKLKIKKAS